MNPKYLQTATRLGNRICRDAIRHKGLSNWIAAGSDPETPMSSKPYYHSLKGDWYSGTSGIAFFLANLFTVSGERLHRQVAVEAMRQALSALPEIEHGKLGFHSGVTGIGFAAVHVGELLACPDLTEDGLKALTSLDDLPFDGYTLDVVDGCAGAIPAVLSIARRYPSPKFDSLLDKMGKHLLETMEKEPSGYSWPTFPGAKSNLTGLAHGTSGIASALLELWAHTGDATYLNVATGGFAYEESHFVPEKKNWPDFRNYSDYEGLQMAEPTGPTCGCAWCHGAPGIGMARLRAFELTQNPSYRHFAEQAVETTAESLDNGLMANFSLCHGVCGNADLLLYAADVLGDEALVSKAETAVERLITDFEQKGTPIPNGGQNDFFVPDMMLGLAGMGYCLLRLADRQRFGSVLLLN
ncbi:MAG: hypothetical protein GC192_21195 [Bacteroidetes bacterium]|nr:hypothetical protein [Bacteroidota bacterium]